METDRGYLGIKAQAPCARDHAALLARFQALSARLGELSSLKKPTPSDKKERKAISARADALAAQEKTIEARCPGLSTPEGDSALLLALFGRSNDDLEAEIRSTYEKKHLLSLDDRELIAHARAANEDSLKKFEGFLADDLLHKAPESDPSYATLAALTETMRRIVESEQKASGFWNDPQAASAAVASYKALMAGVRAKAEQKRTRYALVLKPFLPNPAP
jgi:hypothetical protein